MKKFHLFPEEGQIFTFRTQASVIKGSGAIILSHMTVIKANYNIVRQL